MKNIFGSSFKHTDLSPTIPVIDKSDANKKTAPDPADNSTCGYNQFNKQSDAPSILSNANEKLIKMLGIEAGDSLIRGTDIEGQYASASFRRFLNVMQRINTANRTAIDLTLFEKAKEWSEKFDAVGNAEQLKKLASELKIEITSLEIGKELLLPAGWSSSDQSGHAISMSIKRLSRNRYAVTTHNLGEGLQYHPGYIINGETKRQAFLTRTGVSINRLCDGEFIETFLEMQIAGKWRPLNHSDEFWYESLMPFLGGSLEKPVSYKKYPEYYQTPQRSGTCAMKAIFGALRYQMRNDIPHYKYCKLLYRQQVLQDSLKSFENTGNRSSYKLISGIAKKQAKGIETGYQKWGLSDVRRNAFAEELSQFVPKLKNIKLDRIEKEKIDGVIAAQGNVLEGGLLDFFADENRKADLADGDRNIQQDVDVKGKAPKKRKYKLEFREPHPFDPISTSNLFIDDWIKGSLDCNCLPSLTDEFWKKIPESRLDNWLSALTTLDLSVLVNESKEIKSRKKLQHFYLLAIADILARRHPVLGKKLAGYDLFAPSHLINFAYNPETLLREPKLQWMLLETLKHFGVESIDPSKLSSEEIKKIDQNMAIDGSTRRIEVSSSTISKKSALRFIKQFVQSESDLNEREQIVYLLTGKVKNKLLTDKAKNKTKLPDNLPPALQAIYALLFKSYSRVNDSANNDFQPYNLISMDKNATVIYTKSLFYFKIDDENPDQLKPPLHFQPQNFVVSKLGQGRSEYAPSFTSYDRVGRAIEKFNLAPLSFSDLDVKSQNLRKDEFFTLFFQGPVLLRQLIDEPRTAIQLLQMVQNGIKKYANTSHSLDDNRLEHYLAYTDLAINIRNQIFFAAEKARDVYAPFIDEITSLAPDFTDTLREELLPDCTHNQKIRIIEFLANYHAQNNHAHLKNNLEATLKDIFLGVTYSRCLLDPGSLRPFLENQAEVGKALSYVLKIKLGHPHDAVNPDWKTNHLGLSFKSGDYVIYLYDGIITYKGQEIDRSIPASVLSELKAKKLVNEDDPIKWNGDHRFSIKTENGSFDLEILRDPEDLKWTLSRQVGDHHYKFVPHSLNNSVLPDPLIGTLWQCRDPNHLLIENDAGRQFFMHVDQDRVFSISDDLQNSRSLVTPVDSSFAGFADKSNVLYWKNNGSGREIDSIDLPNHLRFEVSDKGIECTTIPGYSITDNRKWKQKLGISHLIVMQNQNGQEKVLLRVGKMAVQNDGPGQTFDPVLTPQKEGKWDYRVFDVVPSPDGNDRLAGYSSEQMLLLIDQLILKKRYSQAAAYLQQTQFVKGLDDNSIEVLKGIITSSDKHPDANLIKLRAALLLSKNKIFFGGVTWKSLLEAEELKSLIEGELYTNYLANKESCHISLLNKDEELEILRHIKGKPKKDTLPGTPPEKIQYIVPPQIIQRLSVIAGTQKEDTKNRVSPLLSLSPFIKRTLLTAKEIFKFKFETKTSPLPKLSGPIDVKTAVDFNSAYQIACYGTKEEKNALRSRLQLIKEIDCNPFYLSVLRCSLTFPLTFSLFTVLGPAKKFRVGEDRFLISLMKFFIQKVSYIKRVPAFALLLASDILDGFSKRTFDGPASDIKPSSQSRRLLDHALPKRNKVPGSTCLSIDKTIFSRQPGLQPEEILKKLNSYPVDTKSGLLQLSGELKPVTWDEAVGLFLCGENAYYKVRNPYLNDSQIAQIDALIGSYLSQMVPDHLGEREYDHNIAPEIVRAFLVFEYRNGLLLRKQQIAALCEFAKKELDGQIVSKQGTGSGKSKVQYPLLQFLRQKFQPTMNIWPKALFPTNRDDMHELVKNSFGQSVEVFPFNRQFPLDAPTINALNRSLYLGVKNRSQFNAVPENIQSSELTMLELLYNISTKRAPEDESLFFALRNTQLLFKEMGNLVDESHITQDPKKELNFSIGRSTTENDENVQLIAAIFSCLLKKDRLNLKSNNQHLAKEEDFKQVEEDLCVEMKRFFNIDQVNFASFKKFIQDRSSIAPDWIAKREDRDRIALVRGFICELMRDCFKQKSTGVNYGTADTKKMEGPAIPYAGNNAPLKSSEYDIVYETLVKTYHTYIHKGIDEAHCLKLISRMRDQALDESRLFGHRLEETESYKRYETFRSGMMKNLFDVNEESKEDLAILRKHNAFISDYVTLFVAPDVKKYPNKLKSTAQNLRSQFGGMVTMSATPGHSNIYAPNPTYRDGSPENDRLIEGRIRTVCNNPDSLHTVDKETSESFLGSLISILLQGREKGKDFRMLIDTGVLLKGVENLTVAEALLNNLPENEVKGILFFDEEDRLVVLEKGAKKPVPFAETRLTKEELFTYCDHKHIFGADTKQTAKAVGLCTFDVQMTYEEMMQGAGRLRDLLAGQEVQYAFSKSFKDLVSPQKDPVIDSLIEIAKKNSEAAKEEALCRALKQEMHNEVRSRVMEKIRAAKTLKAAVKIFNACKKVLVDEAPKAPWDLYAGTASEIDRKDSLLNYQKHCLQLASSLSSFSRQDKKKLIDALNGYKTTINKLTFTTKTKEVSFQSESQSEVQKEIEMKIEVEKETSSSHQLNLRLRQDADWPENIDFYRDNWINRLSITSIFQRSIQALTKLIKIPIQGYQSIERKIIHLTKKVYDYFNDPSTHFFKKIGIIAMLVTAYTIGMTALLIFCAAALIYPIYCLPLIGIVAGLKIASIFSLKRKPPFKLFEVKNLFKRHANRSISRAASFFSSPKNGRLLTTSNFMPIEDIFNFTPFGIEQKEGFNVLVVKENNNWSVVMGDQTTDVKTWKEKLPKQFESGMKSNRRVFLYDIKLNTITLDGPRITQNSELEKDPTFRQLILHAKLLNGEVYYTKDETEMLEKSVKTERDLKALEDFIKQVLSVHEQKRTSYKGSPLDLMMKKRKRVLESLKKDA